MANSILAQAATHPAPEWDLVAFEVLSWGNPVHRWMVMTNGGGSRIEAVEDDGSAGSRDKSRWYAIAPSTANYVALEEILRGLPKVAPDFNDCTDFTHDLPYGKLRPSRGATTTEIAWNSGCTEPAYLEFMATLEAADELVKGLRSAESEVRTH